MYPKRTVLCFIMLALMKFSNGLRSIWMLIFPLLAADVIIDQCDKPG
jgi:hypothetical protein